MPFPTTIPPGAHRVAAAGNAAAVILLVCVLANGPTLFGAGGLPPGGVAATAPASAPAGGGARGVVLVVVDGLRADTARDPVVMPYLGRLRRVGGSGEARVDCLVPSTVAAVVTLATGRVPPPASFFQDFGARPEPDGGVFAAVSATGGRCFVAGPRLWTDLFGRWIDRARTVEGFGPHDRETLDAGLSAVASGGFRLVVVHLQDVDEAAHRDGAASSRYADAARRCDDAVRRLHLALPAGYGLVVTSDHGNTDRGGHAGPEPEVVTTPLITAGPGLPAGPLPRLRQREIPGLLLRSIGVRGWRPSGEADAGDDSPAGRPALVALGVAAALGCGVRLWAGQGGKSRCAVQAFWLNLSVWAALGAVVTGNAACALAVASVVLAATAIGTAPSPARGVLAALGAGCVAGTWRLAVARWGCLPGASVPPTGSLLVSALIPFAVGGGLFRPEWFARPWASGARGVPWRACAALSLALGLGGVGLAAVSLAAFAAGRVLSPSAGGAGAGSSGLRVGVLCGLAPVAWDALLGKTLSLSTVDVRAAYGVIDLPTGFALAAAAVVAADALPLVGLVLGLGPWLRRLRPARLGRFASALAATLTGQAVPMALVLALPAARPGGDAALTALSLDGLLRVACELVYVFLTLAGLLLLVRRPRRPGAPAPDDPGR